MKVRASESDLFEQSVQVTRQENRTDSRTKALLHWSLQVELKQWLKPTGALSAGSRTASRMMYMNVTVKVKNR